MTMKFLGRILLAFAVLAGITVPAAAANAEPMPASFVHLTVRDDHSGGFHTTSLTCQPSGGHHPKADQACESLFEARGKFDSLRSQKAQCPLIYKPVTVSAHGSWQQTPIHFTKTFSNACVAKSQTEAIFDF